MLNLPTRMTPDGRRIIYVPTAWDDMKYLAQGINPLGAASDPTRDTTDGTFLFSPTLTNIIAGGALFPHRWKIGSEVEPHIHWTPTTTGSGNVVWRFEYSVAGVGETFPAFTSIDVTSAASGVIDRHQIASFGLVTLPNPSLAHMVKWRISRIGGDGADTYAADAKLLEFDIHIQIDGYGSEDRYSKAGS